MSFTLYKQISISFTLYISFMDFIFKNLFLTGWTKKPKNRLNWENRKKITEKTEPWKKPIKPIKILKKLTGSVRFRFYKPKTEKTEPKPSQTGLNLKPKPNQTKPKPKKIRKNWAKSDKNRSKPEKTKPNWFESVFVLKN
jgi:hypothetical protein